MDGGTVEERVAQVRGDHRPLHLSRAVARLAERRPVQLDGVVEVAEVDDVLGQRVATIAELQLESQAQRVGQVVAKPWPLRIAGWRGVHGQFRERDRTVQVGGIPGPLVAVEVHHAEIAVQPGS